jgi:hypothetical protein
MKSGGKVCCEDRIPKFDREFLNGCNVLDACVVDKYIDRPEFSVTEVKQVLDIRRVSQIGLVVTDFGSVSGEFGVSAISDS